MIKCRKSFSCAEAREETNYARMPTRIATVGKKPAHIPSASELIMFCRERTVWNSFSLFLFVHGAAENIDRISELRELKKLIIEFFLAAPYDKQKCERGKELFTHFKRVTRNNNKPENISSDKT